MKRLVLPACAALLLAACAGVPSINVQLAIVPPTAIVLGERVVAAPEQRQVIELGPNDGVFTSLAFVVLDNDVDITECVVTYDNGEREVIPGHFVVRRGARSEIVLHRGGHRRIVNVEFRYRPLGIRAGRQARVTVYGLRPSGQDAD